MFSIGELSRRTGIKVPTIRYYEQIGLVAEPERSRGNQRRYTAEALQRLTFIRHARELGLSLDAIRELTDLSENPRLSCGQAHAIASAHLRGVSDRIRQLKALETELERIVASCNSGSIGDCQVIQALSDHSLCETEHA